MTKNLLSRFKNDESGATAIEYGMIAGLLAVAIITILLVLGPQLEAVFNGISGALTAGGYAPAAAAP